MDSFTESLLTRARDRQKLLDGYTEGTPQKPPVLSPKNTVSASQPNLNTKEPASEKFNPAFKENNSDGNISVKYPRTNSSTTRVSSEFKCSSQSQLKSFNIQNDNFNMEIKMSSVDNVRLEVQIEEQSDDSTRSEGGLRQDAKNRLNRLGKLYAGGDDAEISSPIHRTEENFHAEDEEDEATSTKSERCKKGLSKLADLAQNINQWDDNYTHVQREHVVEKSTPKKKSPAPQPPKVNLVKTPGKTKAPSPPRIVSENLKEKNTTASKILQWDKKVLDSLEKSDGYEDRSHRFGKENVIVEKSEPEEAKKVVPKSPQKPRTAIADKAALFESGRSSPVKASTKDPALLSVSERKALFEKNKGSALVPKAPFGMNAPTNKPETPKKPAILKAKPTKYQAPKAPAVETIAVPAAKVENKPMVAQCAGIANTVAALFESKTTISQGQIENNIREERQREMNMLLNRFNKTKPELEEEVTCDEPDDFEDATEETAMLPPSKTPTKITASATSLNKIESRQPTTGNKRVSKGDSPKVTAILSDVKRIKVTPQRADRLYPSLTDIESQTETESHSPTPNSSFESDGANTSLGRDILKAVCKNQSPVKRQMFDESGSSGMSDLLDEMDDYIDEALAYDEAQGPTPPKQQKANSTQPSHSFNYKSFQSPDQFKSPMKVVSPPRKSNDFPTYIVDGDNVLPLTHTVSFYRKQQTQSSNSTPVRQVTRQPIVEETPKEVSNDDEIVANRMKELQCEVTKQEMIISQTSRALNLCNSTREFMGSTEQVEADRVLLVATHRRQAIMHELQRLKVEKSLHPQSRSSGGMEKGTLTISKIVLPLKQKYVTALAAAGGKGHHVVCLIKCGEQVLPTPLVSTVALNGKNSELDLSIPGKIKLENVYSDATVTFEVYCLQAQEELLPHDVKYHIKKPSGKLSTPKKNKQDSKLSRPIKESPAGPHAVRSPTFALMGYVVFSMQARNKRQWSLNNTPSMSPLDGTVEMCISNELVISVEHRGFLTMFEDVSGFGAWHRRWCLLKGNALSYWKYPDDERKVPPIDTISLKNCLTNNVGPVSRDICARPHTFLMEKERIAYPGDKNTLVMICKGEKTIIRHLLSADTKEERIKWCDELNKAIAGLRMYGDVRN